MSGFNPELIQGQAVEEASPTRVSTEEILSRMFTQNQFSRPMRDNFSVEEESADRVKRDRALAEQAAHDAKAKEAAEDEMWHRTVHVHQQKPVLTETETEEKKGVSLPGALPDLTQDPQAMARFETILDPPPLNFNLPEEDCCPITHCLMRDPVSASDGHVYEREAIERWFSSSDKSPLTGISLRNKTLTTIVYVKNAIHKLIEKHPIIKDSKEWYLSKAGLTALVRACQRGNAEALKNLADHDRRLIVHTFADEPVRGKTALELAARSSLKVLETVMELLEKRQSGLGLVALLQSNNRRALPFYLSPDQQIPMILLTLMTWMGQHITEIDQSCLDACIQSARDMEGNSLLHLAATKGTVEIVSILLAHKANLEAVNEHLQTALHVAAASNQVDVLCVLLTKQANLNALDRRQNTALHTAAQAGASEAVVFLLEAGLSAELENSEGQTARQLMEMHQHTVTMQRLDATLAKLQLKEEDVLKAQGPLGAYVLKQQRRITQQNSQIKVLEILNKLQNGRMQILENEMRDLKEQLTKLEKARSQEKRQWDPSSSYELERQRKATGVDKERLQLMLLQNELVKACEGGEEKRVCELLEQGAKGDICNEQGIYPLGAAVWGMNPKVVSIVANASQSALLTWEECEEHNGQHYNEMFMFNEFFPPTYEAWYMLLVRMKRSPFLRAQHLAEAQKIWPSDVLSWEALVSKVSAGTGCWSNGGMSCLHIFQGTTDFHSGLKKTIAQTIQERALFFSA
jgi:ankyrin repeat protein